MTENRIPVLQNFFVKTKHPWDFPGDPVVKTWSFHWMFREQVWSLVRKLSGEGHGNPLQYSCLENPTDGGAWKAAVQGGAEGRAQLSDFTFTFHFPALEKAMATHSSVLACRIPRTGEPGGLPSMGSHRVGHDWSDSSRPGERVRRKNVPTDGYICHLTSLSETLKQP